MTQPLNPRRVAIHSCGEVIGDGLYKLSFVQECRRRFPDAHISWIAGLGTSVFASALAPMVKGLIDEVIENAGIGTFGQLIDPRPPLAGRHFDLVLDTQRNTMRTLCARRIRHGIFLASTGGFWFSDIRPNDRRAFPRSLLGQFGFMLDLVSDAPPGPPEPIRPGPSCVARAVELLPDGPTYVGFAPGAGDASKAWPLARFLEVAAAQARSGRVPVFILGPNERDWRDGIRVAIPGALFPQTVADQGAGPDAGPEAPDGAGLVIALGQRMAAALTNDSGAGHMLALSQVPLVSLYSKADPRKYVLNVPRLTIIDSKTYGGPDPALIPLDVVVQALESLLDERL